jgi:ATP phosphoribosyltransferase regulatory subunit
MRSSEIPRGTRTLPPLMAAKRRKLQDTLLDVFLRWGFQEVVTPTFEYLDALTLGLGEAFNERLFKLEERHTGRMISLRPDITTQIAKLAATRLKDEPRPLRFCYVANVFRYSASQTRNMQELYQAGVELIGLESPEADAEMIAIAVESMQSVGLHDFRIAVSQPALVRQVLQAADLPPEALERVQAALAIKDTSTLEAVVTQCDLTDQHRETLLELTNLCGKAEVFGQASKVIHNAEAQHALDHLAQVYDMLHTYSLEDHVLIDLGELRGFEYYTGIMFEGFAPNFGYQVCSGGRYDLLRHYGPPDPATGFAIDMGALLEALEKSNPVSVRTGADCLLIDFRQDKRDALRISRELRQRGHRVARDIIQRDRHGSLAYARLSGIPYALLIGAEGLSTDEALLHDVRQGTEARMPIRDVVSRVDAILKHMP